MASEMVSAAYEHVVREILVRAGACLNGPGRCSIRHHVTMVRDRCATQTRPRHRNQRLMRASLRLMRDSQACPGSREARAADRFSLRRHRHDNRC